MKQIRVTELNAHFLCPYRFKLDVEAGGVEETDAMRFGTRVHQILADLNEGKDLDLLDLSAEEKKLIKNAKIFTNYENPPIVEVPMSMRISSSYELKGTADVIVDEGTYLMVHDYKTGYVSYPVYTSLQLFLYFYLFYHTAERVPEGNLTFDFIRKGIRESVQLKDEKIISVAEKGINDFLKDESFEPRLNPFCKFCPYALDCPLIHDLLINGKGPAKKYAADVLRYRISHLLANVDSDASDEEVVSDNATVIYVKKKVQKIDVKTAVSLMNEEELRDAVERLNIKKVPEEVAILSTEESFRKDVQLNYSVLGSLQKINNSV